MSFEATVFMKMRCDDVEYCLKSTRPIQFFFPPEIESHIALEEWIGNCLVRQVKQSVIPLRDDRSSKQGTVIEASCLRGHDERTIHGLVATGRWVICINSSRVIGDHGSTDQARTESLQSKLHGQKHGSTHN